MKTNLLNKYLLTGCLVLLSAMACAQPRFKYRADINPIKTTGAYQLILPPQIVAKCLNGLDDMRILDDKGQAVPYVMQKNIPTKGPRHFIDFKTLPPDNDSTALQVKSTFFVAIQRFYITVKNNAVKRNIDLFGSDDNKKWYAISEDVPLNGPDNSGADHYEQALTFPPSTYRYYKITLSNKNRAPVKIIKAGVYINDTLAVMYQPLPAPIISQKDSNGYSYLKLKFDAPYNIDKLMLAFMGPRYFSRFISFGDYAVVRFSKSPVDLFDLGRTTDLRASIANQDNPPLKLISASAYQISESLMTYLEAGKSYHLAFGDSTVAAPRYDLNYFTDTLQNSLRLASIGPVVHQLEVEKPIAKPGFNFNYILWGAIAVILLGLVYFTYKIMNEVKAKSN